MDSSSECSNMEAYDGDQFSEVGDDVSELDDVEWKYNDLPEEVLIATTSAKPGQYSHVQAEPYESGCTCQGTPSFTRQSATYWNLSIHAPMQ